MYLTLYVPAATKVSDVVTDFQFCVPLAAYSIDPSVIVDVIFPLPPVTSLSVGADFLFGTFTSCDVIDVFAVPVPVN